MRSPRLALLLLVFLLGTSRASAHPAPFSYLDLIVRDGRIDGALVLHVLDVAHDLGFAREELLMEPRFAAQERDRIVALVANRLHLVVNGTVVRPQWMEIQPVPERHGLQLRFTIGPIDTGALSIDTNLFPYDPVHQTFVNVYEGTGLRDQMIFNVDSPPRTYYAGTTRGTLAVVRTFVPSGIRHILIGPDHILFLVGLLLLGGGWKTLLTIVTAFTIGHSITLSLAALGIVTPPAELVEPAIALSIVFVGADNLMRGSGRDLRAVVALAFGLIHGFGFANVLREFGLPREAMAWSLFSFNAGVEIGQLGVVVVVVAMLAAIRRRSQRWGASVATAGSVLVIAAGAYWFIQRVFFAA